MGEVKDKLIGLGIIIFIICGGLSLLFWLFSELFNAFLWAVYFDNAETGLPMVAEIIVKAIVEISIGAILTCVGISKAHPLVKVLVMILGFFTCLACYWIAAYIIWIMIGALLLASGIIILFVIQKKKNKKFKKENVINDSVGI